MGVCDGRLRELVRLSRGDQQWPDAPAAGLPEREHRAYLAAGGQRAPVRARRRRRPHGLCTASGVTTPGTVQQQSPANGATNQTTTPTLSWNAPTNAISGTTQYTVSIKTSSGTALANLAPTT